jgi:DNA-binding winged helix-turn-helix (wHTH) protein
MELHWGASNPAFRQIFTSQFIPNATEEQRNWFNDLQAKSTSPALAAALYRAIHKLDVRDRLAQVRAPTLVLHSRNDAAIPFSAGRALAAGIPSSRLVPLPDDNHLPHEASPAWPLFCREVAEFSGLAEEQTPPKTELGSENLPYRFGCCCVDGRSRELRRDGRLIATEHRVFDTLVYLIEHRDRAVSKEELQDAIWPGMILTESALTRCIMKARRAVGDDPQRQDVIKTIHGHGYRFVAALDAHTGA